MKPDKVIKRLRWVMVCVIFFDFANTLLGQPGTYWQHPETVNEHNPLFHALLAHSWLLFVLFNLFYLAGAFLVVSFARRRLALVVLFSLIFCHFYGGSTWLDRHWGFGSAGLIVYGVLLATTLVLLGFPKTPNDIRTSS